MKTVFGFLVTACLLSTGVAHAESELFEATSLVTKNKLASSNKTFYSENRFSDLEQLGVQMAALNEAVLKCKAAGYKVCHATSWSLGACNSDEDKPDASVKLIKCVGKASVVGIKKTGY